MSGRRQRDLWRCQPRVRDAECIRLAGEWEDDRVYVERQCRRHRGDECERRRDAVECQPDGHQRGELSERGRRVLRRRCGLRRLQRNQFTDGEQEIGHADGGGGG